MSKEELVMTVYDAITGETETRPFTDDERNNYLALQAEEQALKAEQEAKASARESALAKLAALGLTEEEIAAL
jgi:DNA-binding NarL/FixJ family response regulator